MIYSNLQRRLAAGQIVVTGEMAPPKGGDPTRLLQLAQAMQPSVDAINLTDNQRGVARMSSLGAAAILRQAGIEPIMQMTCQHRNRIALQADALSASALGVRNILCMTGDHPRIGDHPQAKNVLDLNSFQLIRMLRKLRDEARFDSGGQLKEPPQFFVGGVANPNVERAARLEKKVQSGAEFIQTQLIFDVARFRTWMADVRAAGLHQQAHILAGVMVLRRPHSALYLRDHLPGTLMPDGIVDRMQAAEDSEREGISIAAELVSELLSVEGVAGVHIMSVDWTRAIPQIIERAGMLPRPDLPE
ncbi:methylenetetrahydrofolate reductase [Oscillochloris trichoides DG-6]|uniref:Methylenetetrahydrofolate reductase n=1 Tax=Oscillochloris trichoides DG-6 TaxID=765420 RepID=E1IIH7_9CHLR|nr:methylenetetrahydrofolate reductase [Oscillochloris trichoides]EFO79052.1 methylenetetrahydrofolate reductase [Oscillochloris trichoides DG-6]